MKIASFNIQKFGRSKVSDPEVLNILTEIVSRYDIILILEVVDASGKSIKTFMEALNKTRYKEQFMFLYRPWCSPPVHPLYETSCYSPLALSRLSSDRLLCANGRFHQQDDLVDLVSSYQFDDEVTEGGDVFARDPYILRFRCLNTVLKDLVMIPVHTKPEDSEKELDELYDVFQNVKKKWRTDNIMILGDFNADGAYVSNRDMKTIRIRKDKNFHWLIGDDVDTTASPKNTNTYDRIVVYGDDMLNAVVPNSAKTFNFQEEFKLSEEQALKVSDHYPVEVELKSIVKTDEIDGLKNTVQVPAPAATDEDLLDLKRGNLLLEREKLNLEIQILQMKLAKMNRDA